jgi:hypothetical protein
VVLVRDQEKFLKEAKRLLSKSELVIAQEYVPSTFDWRIGNPGPAGPFSPASTTGRQALADPAQGRQGPRGLRQGGDPARGQGPKTVVRMGLIGRKPHRRRPLRRGPQADRQEVYVIEVNDNPNIDAGNEDEVLQDELYLRIMDVFLRRIEARKSVGGVLP